MMRICFVNLRNEIQHNHWTNTKTTDELNERKGKRRRESNSPSCFQ